ncbi:hypothetical protein DF142_23860 [Burkholderia cenocepacia]|nr:hypothetical protein DF142_23860 [Burkholderia cenocepacia]RQU57668.1 hypothetical protein DF140_31605 [Burkholderia cenocepacia]
MRPSLRRCGFDIDNTRRSYTPEQHTSFEGLAIFAVPATPSRATRSAHLHLPAPRHRRVTSRT